MEMNLSSTAVSRLNALHGFLGKPEDWAPLFKVPGWQDQLVADDILDYPRTDFWRWADRYNLSVSSRKQPGERNVMLGYSLGGRLGLHALLKQPDLWSAAIFVSTHPGLTTAEAKESKHASDLAWAERFEKEPWDTVMRDWNAQGAFAGDTFHFNRRESDYQRWELAATLRDLSLGLQNDLLPQLAAVDIPVLWLVGSDDKSAMEHSRRVKFAHHASRVVSMPKAGHRLPWQHPELFLTYITQFLNEGKL